MTSASRAPAHHGALAPHQFFILAIFGTILWFIAAMLVRILGPLGALSGVWRMVTYTLVVPGTIPAVLLARPIARLRRDQTATGITVVTAAALLLDGVAFAWFPMLYASDPASQLAGAAVILWGAGVGLVLGLAMNQQQ
jgi:hypothetical protein